MTGRNCRRASLPQSGGINLCQRSAFLRAPALGCSRLPFSSASITGTLYASQLGPIDDNHRLTAERVIRSMSGCQFNVANQVDDQTQQP